MRKILLGWPLLAALSGLPDEGFDRAAKAFVEGFSADQPERVRELTRHLVAAASDKRGVALLAKKLEELQDLQLDSRESLHGFVAGIEDSLRHLLELGSRPSPFEAASPDERLSELSRAMDASWVALRRSLDAADPETSSIRVAELEDSLSAIEAHSLDRLARTGGGEGTRKPHDRLLASSRDLQRKVKGLARALREQATREAVIAVLRSGMIDLLDLLPPSDRSESMRWLVGLAATSLLRTVKEVDPHAWRRQVLYLDVLGDVGGTEELDLAPAWIENGIRRIEALERALSEAREDLGRWERIVHRAVQTGGGRIPESTRESYEDARMGAERLTRGVLGEGRVLSAVSAAVARILGRLDQEGRGVEVVEACRRLLATRDVRARPWLVEGMGSSRAPSVTGVLVTAAQAEQDAAMLGTLLEALGRLGSEDALPVIVGRGLGHPSWRVQATAVSALARIPSAASVDALLACLEGSRAVARAVARGRLLEDVGLALQALTGRDFHGDVVLWRRFWDAHREGFDFSTASRSLEAVALEREGEREGVSFYGISTRSTRVAFVIDVSSSMLDRSGSSGRSKLELARRELEGAIAALEEGASFNIVLYHFEVTVWSPAMVTLDSRTRQQAARFIEERLVPGGGTNLFGGIRAAFALAGVGPLTRPGEPGVDTVFLLSDGRPTAGEIRDPESILELVRQLNRRAGIVIHTIGLGNDHDRAFLRALAEQNGGRYVGR